jgi:hypothetical protein
MAQAGSGTIKDLRIAKPAEMAVMTVSRWQDGASGGTNLWVRGALPNCQTQECV